MRLASFGRLALFAAVLVIVAPLELHMRWIEAVRFHHSPFALAVAEVIASGGLFLVALTLAVTTYFDVEDVIAPKRPSIGYWYRVLCGVPLLMYVIVPPPAAGAKADPAFMAAQSGAALLIWLVAVAVRAYAYTHESVR